ncbi:MAG: hypothetical protein ACR2GY_10900 [Phycisphaerales bacterium]
MKSAISLILLLMTVGACRTAVEGQSGHHQPPEEEQVDMTNFEMPVYRLNGWDEIQSLVEAIELMPAWDKVQMTEDEQERSIRIAYNFQHVDPKRVSDALIMYMGRIPLLHMSSEEDARYQSKPMILLRILFNLPAEPLSEVEYNTLTRTDLGGPGGFKPGYYAASLGFPEGEPIWRTWWYPITWEDDRPQFHEGPRYPIAGQNLATSYHPHLQFEYMREHFDYRDLKELFTEEFQPEYLGIVLDEAQGNDVEGYRYADERRRQQRDKK